MVDGRSEPLAALIGGDRYRGCVGIYEKLQLGHGSGGQGGRAGTDPARGRPRESFIDPVVRWMRQTGNPNIGVAEMARMKINYYNRPEKTYERNWLDRAVAAGDCARVDDCRSRTRAMSCRSTLQTSCRRARLSGSPISRGLRKR